MSGFLVLSHPFISYGELRILIIGPQEFDGLLDLGRILRRLLDMQQSNQHIAICREAWITFQRIRLEIVDILELLQQGVRRGRMVQKVQDKNCLRGVVCVRTKLWSFFRSEFHPIHAVAHTYQNRPHRAHQPNIYLESPLPSRYGMVQEH